MKLRSIVWLPATAAALMMLVAALWFFGSGYPFIERFQFDTLTTLEPFGAGQEIVQTFKADEDGLSRVDLRFDIAALGGGNEIVFELYEVADPGTGEAVGPPRLGEEIREVRLEPELFFWMHRFAFAPVEDSKGKTYAFKVYGERNEGSEIRLRASGADAYRDGALFIDGEPAGRDLNMAIFHTGGDDEIFAQIKPFRPFPLNSGLFFTTVFLIGAGAFGWLLRIVARN